MSKEQLLSLHNSGESLEKSIVLFYNAIQNNFSFYDEFQVSAFYSHNLPKTNLEIDAHGTIGFYEKYFQNSYWCPPCSRNYLWKMKDQILNDLVEKKIITIRIAQKLEQNEEIYWLVISRLPFSYIYPEFYKNLLINTKNILKNISFIPTDLEKNVEEIYQILPFEKNFYSIYGLEANGIIGHYDMEIKQDYRYQKRFEHLLSDLQKRIVLSGNSAMFIASIQRASKNMFGIVGYRNHKYSRISRDTALYYLLNEHEGIIEPKNIWYNHYYDKVLSIQESEAKSNEVVALAYQDFIQENILCLKL